MSLDINRSFWNVNPAISFPSLLVSGLAPIFVAAGLVTLERGPGAGLALELASVGTGMLGSLINLAIFPEIAKASSLKRALQYTAIAPAVVALVSGGTYFITAKQEAARVAAQKKVTAEYTAAAKACMDSSKAVVILAGRPNARVCISLKDATPLPSAS